MFSVRNGDNAYLPFGIFRYRNIWMSMLLFLIVMVFNSANIFVGSFLKLSTSADNFHSASLGVWAMAGCFAGLVLSILLVMKKVRFRTVFVIAFLLMALSNGLMYFQYQTEGLVENMIWPTILNFTGLLMLYSLVAAFGMKNLPARYLVAFVFLMIWMRNSIAPVVGSSIYSNWLQQKQQYYISRLSCGITSESDRAASEYNANFGAARYSGKGDFESSRIASAMIKSRVAVQATIVSMKSITGTTIILLLTTSFLVFLLPYHKRETT